MTLTSVLQSVQGVVLASLNFSSRSTPEIIMKTFAQYCVYTRKGKDTVLEPAESLGASSWLVVFCDEINLPEEDTYGTQRGEYPVHLFQHLSLFLSISSNSVCH